MKTLQASLLSLALACALLTPSFALAADAAVDPAVAVTEPVTGPAAPVAQTELDEFAAREAASQLDEFQGGDSVVVGTSTILLVLLVVLIVVIIL